MSHVVLLGDSIFDNASYVPGEPPVVDQLRTALPAGWRATLLAIDGNVTADVLHQLARLPTDATHLIVSAGGNDALGASEVLQQPARSVAEALFRLTEVQSDFRNDYREMLAALAATRRPAAVCTIYDSIPGMERVALTGLCLFNDCIVHEAARARLPVIDLRLICTDATDYSSVSPIEPSARGGRKIARAIAELVTGHDFAAGRTVVYGCQFCDPGTVPMIRPSIPEESDTLVAIAASTGVFKPREIETLREVLDDYHGGPDDVTQHRAVSYERDGRVIGFAYYAPTPMTVGTWHLFWIFVDRSIQARGVGAELMRYAENDIRSMGGRVLVIETSGMPHYELTRKFYLKMGYQQVAVIPDFYADGDDQVIFWKRLSDAA